jgi:epoxyqueuosine reductase
VDALEQRIKRQASTLGFDPVGIARLGPVDSHDAFVDWLRRGYAGEMEYLQRGADKRRDTTLPFPGVRSAIVVALDYGGRQPPGTIARYARGDDYHDVMVGRLDELHRWLATGCGRAIRGKSYVDTGPRSEERRLGKECRAERKFRLMSNI